jgi:hypothetical protein
VLVKDEVTGNAADSGLINNASRGFELDVTGGVGGFCWTWSWSKGFELGAPGVCASFSSLDNVSNGFLEDKASRGLTEDRASRGLCVEDI